MTWLWRRRRLDEEFRREIDAHLDLLIERYVRSGMTPDVARAEAMRQFGNVTRHREELHMLNGVRGIDGLFQDVRYAVRQLRHSVGFSAVVVVTLALGIGGTTAVFSAMHAVLLAPLPYGQPGQLVRIYQEEPGNPAARKGGVSAPHFGRCATRRRRSKTSARGIRGTTWVSTWRAPAAGSVSVPCSSRAIISALSAPSRFAGRASSWTTKRARLAPTGPAGAAWC